MKKLWAIIFALGFVLAHQVFASETSEAMKHDVEKFKKEMTVKLNDLDSKIAVLKEKTKAGADESKTKALGDLEASRDRLRKQIDELDVNAQSGWKKMKNRMSYSFDKLNNKVQKLLK